MTAQNTNPLSRAQITQHIDALQGNAERRTKFLKSCDALTRGLDCSAEDLLQDACLKLLHGDRNWPANVTSPEAYFTQVIRSLADARRKKLRTDRVDYGMNDELYGQIRDTRPSPEHDNPAIHIAEADASRQRFEDLLVHFKGKPEVQLLILLRAKEYGPQEIMKIMGFNEEQYRATCKRMERGLNDFREQREPSP